MPSNDIVTTGRDMPPNPFAKQNALSVPGMAMGAVAIEQERAVAEAKSKLLIAKSFPRNQGKAFDEIVRACRRPEFARAALYAYPRGPKAIVTGPSIRMAEMLAQAWGNIEFGTRELSQAEGQSEMEAYAWDLETNTLSQQRFTVSHKSLAKDQRELTDTRDIYERVANDGARRLRARILAVIPKDVADAAVTECQKTLKGSSDVPLSESIRRMVSGFSRLGVTAEMLAAYLGHPVEKTTPDEIADMLTIYNSISEGHSKASRWFPQKASEGTAAANLNSAVKEGDNSASH